jgi:hypothetical protein
MLLNKVWFALHQLSQNLQLLTYHIKILRSKLYPSRLRDMKNVDRTSFIALAELCH